MKLALLFLMAGVGCLGQTAKQVEPQQVTKIIEVDCKPDDNQVNLHLSAETLITNCHTAAHGIYNLMDYEERIKALEDRVKVLESRVDAQSTLLELYRKDAIEKPWIEENKALERMKSAPMMGVSENQNFCQAGAHDYGNGCTYLAAPNVPSEPFYPTEEDIERWIQEQHEDRNVERLRNMNRISGWFADGRPLVIYGGGDNDTIPPNPPVNRVCRPDEPLETEGCWRSYTHGKGNLNDLLPGDAGYELTQPKPVMPKKSHAVSTVPASRK